MVILDHLISAKPACIQHCIKYGSPEEIVQVSMEHDDINVMRERASERYKY
jgi:hypothetical protein